ncbi:MAG: PAS domain-containing protein [Candidatus Limnocylindrales bacterium]
MHEPQLSADAYRQLVEQSPVLTWQSDLTKACDYFNERWLAWTGRTLAQELGNGWADGVHADDFDRCVGIHFTAFDARQPFEMEYRLRRADGEYRWIWDRGVPFEDDQGRFAGFIGSCIDVHDAVEGRAAKARVMDLEMNRLTGLLPICAACHKIRDDVGYWQSVEQYVTRHSDAQFTHGYCPICDDIAVADLDAMPAVPDGRTLQRT